MHPGIPHITCEHFITSQVHRRPRVLHIIQNDRVGRRARASRYDKCFHTAARRIDNSKRSRRATAIDAQVAILELTSQEDNVRAACDDAGLCALESEALEDPLLAAESHSDVTSLENEVVLRSLAIYRLMSGQ